jgi:hypothetical protein
VVDVAGPGKPGRSPNTLASRLERIRDKENVRHLLIDEHKTYRETAEITGFSHQHIGRIAKQIEADFQEEYRATLGSKVIDTNRRTLSGIARFFDYVEGAGDGVLMPKDASSLVGTIRLFNELAGFIGTGSGNSVNG